MPATMTCPDCGTPRVPDARFCHVCGHVLDATGAVATAPAPSAPVPSAHPLSAPPPSAHAPSALEATAPAINRSHADPVPPRVRIYHDDELRMAFGTAFRIGAGFATGVLLVGLASVVLWLALFAGIVGLGFK